MSMGVPLKKKYPTNHFCAHILDAYYFCVRWCGPKLQDKHCKSTMTKTKTMTITGKIRYMPPP